MRRSPNALVMTFACREVEVAADPQRRKRDEPNNFLLCLYVSLASIVSPSSARVLVSKRLQSNLHSRPSKSAEVTPVREVNGDFSFVVCGLVRKGKKKRVPEVVWGPLDRVPKKQKITTSECTIKLRCPRFNGNCVIQTPLSLKRVEKWQEIQCLGGTKIVKSPSKTKISP